MAAQLETTDGQKSQSVAYYAGYYSTHLAGGHGRQENFLPAFIDLTELTQPIMDLSNNLQLLLVESEWNHVRTLRNGSGKHVFIFHNPTLSKGDVIPALRSLLNIAEDELVEPISEASTYPGHRIVRMHPKKIGNIPGIMTSKPLEALVYSHNVATEEALDQLEDIQSRFVLGRGGVVFRPLIMVEAGGDMVESTHHVVFEVDLIDLPELLEKLIQSVPYEILNANAGIQEGRKLLAQSIHDKVAYSDAHQLAKEVFAATKSRLE